MFREQLLKKKRFLLGIAQIQTCTTFFGRQKWRLALITEPSNNDYDNDVSDNCDHNFGTFDDFGVK